jgi:hypothetical protein
MVKVSDSTRTGRMDQLGVKALTEAPMRWFSALLLLLLTAGVASAQQHDWHSYGATIPGWDGRTDTHLGCAGNELTGYALAPEWASEVQVIFELPEPPEGGPWMVEYVAFFVSGQGTHQIRLRRAQSGVGVPGAILADDLTFAPVYSTWPPAEWTYVPLKDSAAYPHALPCAAGEFISVGFELLPDDAIGLTGGEAGTTSWSYFSGSWINDTHLGVVAAVRLGLTDLGLSEANKSTWGGIKDLFSR